MTNSPGSVPHLSSPRQYPFAWALVGLLTFGTMAVWWSESEAYRDWTVLHRWGNNTRTWGKPYPVPERPWSIWPHWVDEWRTPIQRRFQLVQLGSMVLGLGLTIVASPRWNRGSNPVARRRQRLRRGPGEIAMAISTAWMAVTTLAAVSYEWVYPWLPTFTPNPWSRTVTIPQQFLIGFPGQATSMVAESIAAAWLYLALTGRWRRRPADLIDRVGRWIGWTWIGTRSATFLADLIGIIRSYNY